MEKVRIGIICPSEIALRRFMPALQQIEELQFVGIGVCTAKERFEESELDMDTVEKALKSEHDKAQVFIDQYGGKLFESYETIVSSDEIDAMYIPLPPALHYKWAKMALDRGKHVLVEKPSTLSAADSKSLVDLAASQELALHENYMFAFHKQLDAIDEIVNSGELGDIRLYRISFGFPRRAANDFRYNKALGGGALIDAGGYTIKYATRLLGKTAEFKYKQLNYINEYDVDIYGSAALVNNTGVTAQIAFGMDNSYKCELEAWGSKGCLRTRRVLTAPAGFVPEVTIKIGNETQSRKLPLDDSFQKSIRHFLRCITDTELRESTYEEIVKQAEMIDCMKGEE